MAGLEQQAAGRELLPSNQKGGGADLDALFVWAPSRAPDWWFMAESGHSRALIRRPRSWRLGFWAAIGSAQIWPRSGRLGSRQESWRPLSSSGRCGALDPRAAARVPQAASRVLAAAADLGVSINGGHGEAAAAADLALPSMARCWRTWEHELVHGRGGCYRGWTQQRGAAGFFPLAALGFAGGARVRHGCGVSGLLDPPALLLSPPSLFSNHASDGSVTRHGGGCHLVRHVGCVAGLPRGICHVRRQVAASSACHLKRHAASMSDCPEGFSIVSCSGLLELRPACWSCGRTTGAMASLLELWPVYWSCGRFVGAAAGMLRWLTKEPIRAPEIGVLERAASAAALLDELGSIRCAAGGCSMKEGGHLQRGRRCPAQGHLLQDRRCHDGGCLLQGGRPPGGGHLQEGSGNLPDHGGAAAWSCNPDLPLPFFYLSGRLRAPGAAAAAAWMEGRAGEVRRYMGGHLQRRRRCPGHRHLRRGGRCFGDGHLQRERRCPGGGCLLRGGRSPSARYLQGESRYLPNHQGLAAESCNPDLSFFSSYPSGRLRAPGAAAAAAWIEGRAGKVGSSAQVSLRVDCAALAECGSVDGAGEPHFGKVVAVAEGGEAVTTPSSGHAHLVTPTSTSGSAWSIDQSLAGWAA